MPVFELSSANAVGLVAVLITVSALLRRNNDGLLLLLGFGVSLWAVHYWLLGTIPGAVMHGIAAVSIFLAHAIQNSDFTTRACTAGACSSLGVSASLFFGSGLADAIAAVGCVVMTMTQYLGRGVAMRLGFLAGEFLFLLFAVLVGSIPGIAVTVSNLVAGLVGIIKMTRQNRNVMTEQTTEIGQPF